MLTAAMAAGASEGEAGGAPGVPQGVVCYYYDSTLIGVQWAIGTGDVDGSQVGFSETTEDPTEVTETVPGTRQTTYETGGTDYTYWFVRHYSGSGKDATYSDWVIADPPAGAPE
jgi:hypothetical protein